MSKTPHKHVKVIKAWAYGEKIQFSHDGIVWADIDVPTWHDDIIYRVKPEDCIVSYTKAEIAIINADSQRILKFFQFSSGKYVLFCPSLDSTNRFVDLIFEGDLSKDVLITKLKLAEIKVVEENSIWF